MQSFYRMVAVAGSFVLSALATDPAAARQPKILHEAAPPITFIASSSTAGICDDFRPLDHDMREACVIAQTFCLFNRDTMLAKARGQNISKVMRDCVAKAMGGPKRHRKGSEIAAPRSRDAALPLERGRLYRHRAG